MPTYKYTCNKCKIRREYMLIPQEAYYEKICPNCDNMMHRIDWHPNMYYSYDTINS